MKNTLKDIQKLLDEKDQPSTFLKASDEAPYDRLLVAFGAASPDEKDDVIEISAQSQFFEGSLTNDKATDSYHLIQFQYVLPLDLSPSTFNQVSSALHFFNRLLHCPGFELDELDNQVLFRYVWFVGKAGLDSLVLMQVLGNIQLCYKMFRPYVKEIAEGKYTLEDILEKVVQLTKKD
jgi:hypothetical protein